MQKIIANFCSKRGLNIPKTRKLVLLMQDIPIIAVTARAMKDDKHAILSAGCDDYISKPKDPDLLMQSIEKWNKT